MVVDNGQIIQYDNPQTLLENEDGQFYKFIRQAGLLPATEDDKVQND